VRNKMNCDSALAHPWQNMCDSADTESLPSFTSLVTS